MNQLRCLLSDQIINSFAHCFSNFYDGRELNILFMLKNNVSQGGVGDAGFFR